MLTLHHQFSIQWKMILVNSSSACEILKGQSHQLLGYILASGKLN
jgi:hypothetical protein